MYQQRRVRFFAGLFLLASSLVHLLAFLGKLTGRSSAMIHDRYETLLFSLPFISYGWIVLYISLFLYLLYSANVLAPFKSEFARQYTAIADVGLLLLCPFEIARITAWHYGWIGVAMLLRIICLVILVRVGTAYPGDPTRPFWGRAVFDFWMGWTEFLLVTDLAMAVAGLSDGTPPFSENFWNVFLLIVASTLSSWIGLKLLSPLSIFAMLSAIGSVAGMHLSATGLDGRYPVIYISAILCMAGLVTVLLICLIKRRRSYWR